MVSGQPVFVSHSPFSRLVSLSRPPIEVCPWSLSVAHSISLSWSRQGTGALLPISRDSVWTCALAALGQSLGCGAGAPWRGATAELQPLGLVAILPDSLVMSLSLTMITGLVLLLRRYSRKSSRSISGHCHSFLLSPSDKTAFLISAFHVGALLLCFLPLAGRRALSPAWEWTWPTHSPMSISPAEPRG